MGGWVSWLVKQWVWVDEREGRWMNDQDMGGWKEGSTYAAVGELVGAAVGLLWLQVCVGGWLS